MKITVVCNSDSLAFPAIQALYTQGLLAAVAILERNKKVLLEPLLAIGIGNENVLQLNKATWQNQLQRGLATTGTDAVWVFGFPWLIPDDLLQAVPRGFINFHFGELPKYRGADPIFWQLKNNEDVATLTIHQITADVDAGPVLYTKQLPIIKGENYGLLCQRLGFVATEAIPQLLNETGIPSALNRSIAVASLFDQKPGNNDLVINWKLQSADAIECLVNAANPKYDGATACIKNTELRILEVSPAEIQLKEEFKPEPGTIVYADALYGLIVACIENRFLKINTVHMREGYFSGSKLFHMGIQSGEKFINLN
ncbi:formyltransferase family protein [Pedobacter suwonensis]|uniref:formyltransferase family protein n=1 Tax=Pedobacter suwonensis TaxID=332999 RepID=UPI0011A77EF2|nr:formyltransferase family protein [Pedobacter suwonensis]